MIKDMTEGSPSKILWRFSIPLLLSVVFQQIYNIVDSVIAGQYIGKNALAAVGASYPIIMIFIAIGTGSNIGCSVIISQLFGQKNYKQMKTAINTSIISVIVISIVLTIVGSIFCNPLINLMNTPKDIFIDSAVYLRIYIFGLLFLFVYNIVNGIFSALGDSKTPLYLLILSSVLNAILALIFAAELHLGVTGVALATFIAQGVAAVLSSWVLFKRLNQFSNIKDSKFFSFPLLKRISRVAVPSILQQSFVSVGNLFVQFLVNGFGSNVIAGYSAAIKLNTFAIISITTLGNGLSNFTAQNIGARKFDRITKGFKSSLIMTFIVIIPFVLLYFIFNKQMMGLFISTKEIDVVNAGSSFLKMVSPFYFVVAVKIISDSVLRGAASMTPYMIGTFTDLILRVILAYLFAYMFHTITAVWISWPVGWTLSSAMDFIFYKSGMWKKTLVKNEE